MSPIQEDALGLALIACSFGILFCRGVISSARDTGVYRRKGRNPVFRSTHPAGFNAIVKFWNLVAWVFAIGAGLDAAVWAVWRAGGN